LTGRKGETRQRWGRRASVGLQQRGSSEKGSAAIIFSGRMRGFQGKK